MLESDDTPRRQMIRVRVDVQALEGPIKAGAIVRQGDVENPIDEDGYVSIEIEYPSHLAYIAPPLP